MHLFFHSFHEVLCIAYTTMAQTYYRIQFDHSTNQITDYRTRTPLSSLQIAFTIYFVIETSYNHICYPTIRASHKVMFLYTKLTHSPIYLLHAWLPKLISARCHCERWPMDIEHSSMSADWYCLSSLLVYLPLPKSSLFVETISV